MRFLFGLLILAARLQGQIQALYLDVSGDWRFHPGDEPQFSSPDFDDATWQTMRLPRTAVPNRGWWWLRRTVELPEWADTTQLALTLGSVNEVYELFVNGVPSGSVGDAQGWKIFTARPRTLRIPAEAVPKGTRRVTLALRLWTSGLTVPDEFGNVHFPDGGPYVLTDVRGAPVQAERASLALRERATSGMLAVGAVELVLGLLLLVCYLFQPNRRDLAWFAGFLFAEAATNGWIFFTVSGDWSQGITPFVGNLLSLGPLLLLQFASPLIRDVRWKRLLQFLGILALLLQVACNIGFEQRFSLAIPLTVLGLMEAGLCLMMVRTASLAWRQNDRQAVWIPAGVAAIALSQLGLVVALGTRTNKASLRIYGINVEILSLLTILVATLVTTQLIRGLGAARQRLQGEVEAARAVQQLLLPMDLGTPRTGCQVDAAYQPASEVGGDFYQVLDREDGSRLVLVGDVSGKGLKAAMLVSLIVGVLRREESSSPAEVLAALNRALIDRTGGGFVTCVCALFAADGTVTIANAGHPAPYSDGREVEVEDSLPLGVLAGVEYKGAAVPGLRFTFVSDGVLEAANADGELFGFERTRQISGKSASEIAETARAWGQNDDITVVTVRRTA